MKTKSTPGASASGRYILGGDMPINRLGFGAMRITGPGIWGDPKDPKEALAVLRRAVELGVNLIDTADSYGPDVSENLIAEALRPYPQDLIIATKGGYTRQGPDRWAAVGRPEYLIQCVEMSLRRLRIDCIDLYQFHTVDALVPIEDSLGALNHMQRQGKIRHIGLSNVSLNDIGKAKKVIDFISVQNMYNLSNRESEGVLQYCEKNDIAFIPWFPIASGSMAHASGALEKIAQKKGVTSAQIALAWLLKRSPVILPIPGTSSVSHLEENIAAGSIQLTDEEFTELNKL